MHCRDSSSSLLWVFWMSHGINHSFSRHRCGFYTGNVVFLMLFRLSIPGIVFFYIKKSCRDSCHDNWNKLNIIYSSYQLGDKPEMSQDSKTSCDVTYSTLLRDAKIEITGIALRIKSCPISPHITLIFLVGLHIYLVFCIMFQSSHRPLERLVPGVGNIATNNGRTCGKYRYSCGNTLLLARWSHGSGVLLSLPGTAPNKLTACLFSVLGEQIKVFNNAK